MRRSHLFLTLITALFAYLAYQLFQPFLIAIAAAMVFAVVFQPIHRKISRWIRYPDLAAFVSTVLILSLVLLPASLVGYSAGRELKSAYTDINQKTKDSGGWMHAFDEAIDKGTAWISDRTGVSADELRDDLNNRVKGAAAVALNFGSSLIAGIGSSVVQAVISFVTLFFFLRDGNRIIHNIAVRIPLPRPTVNRVLSQANDTIVANMYGVIAVAAAQGLMTGLAIWWTGLPSPVLWGVLTAVFSVIPVVGSGIVWLPAAIFLIATGHWGKGVFLLAWGAGVVAMLDNIVRPMVVSERTQLNPLLVFFSLLGGTQLFGLIGVFLGPVIVAVAIVLVDLWSKLPETKAETRAPSADTADTPT